MTAKPKALVLDDETALVKKWADKLNKLPGLSDVFSEITAIDVTSFARELEILRGRQNSFRLERTSNEKSVFDEAGILLVDYDLIGLLGEKLYITGEEVAYLVRCFSDCGLIIGLNFEPGNRFDLTLKDHPDSFADIQISNEQLANPALWGVGESDFRPWSWPLLAKQWVSFNTQTTDVEANLDAPVCQFLGFSAEIVSSFSRSVSEYLGDASKVTFREVATTSLRGKDKWGTPRTLARIAAARTYKWLETVVLPGQDVLVDAPHLGWRYSSLAKGDPSKVATWDQLAKLGTPHDALGLNSGVLEAYRFKKEHWLSRPAWLWKGVSTATTIAEVAEPWKTKTPPFVFCEDRSRFKPKSECKEFVAEMESPYARRFVSPVAGITYAPQVRFSA